MDRSQQELSGDMPSTSNVITETVTEVDGQETPVLRLRLQKPKNIRKVSFSSETVDNEHMNKKKSKCCCIYHKPLKFGESSSESEDECENCFGHVEKKKKNRIKNQNDIIVSSPVEEESTKPLADPIDPKTPAEAGDAEKCCP